MAKFVRILRLVNLLQCRHCVSMEAIRDICGIPERTAYRYLNEISEANIPVYYDREIRAYRLTQSSIRHVSFQPVNEALVAALGVKALCTRLDPCYAPLCEQTLQGILCRQPQPIEGVLVAVIPNRGEFPDIADCTDLLAGLLCRLAVTLDLPLRIIPDHEGTRRVTLIDSGHDGEALGKATQKGAIGTPNHIGD